MILILPLIARQIFSFSSDDSTENFANTNAFKCFSLFLSNHCFPWVPSVLLAPSSCFVEKNCRSLRVQRCLCFSTFNIALLPSLYLVNSSHRFSLPIRAISLFSENFHDLEMTLLQVLAYLVPNIFSYCLKLLSSWFKMIAELIIVCLTI